MPGSSKFAVPTCTALAPAMRNSSTSRAEATPPMPTIGMRTASWHSYTMRTAMGRMAGPLRPPTTLDSRGRRVSTSMAIARNVLTSETASAPASSAATARAATSVTLGVSLGKIGSVVAARTARTTSRTPAMLHPNVWPPWSTLGQETLISMAATPSASDRIRAISAYSSTVEPQTLTMTTARRARSAGSLSATKARTPMPCSPMALSMPLGVSTMRGGACPSRASRNRPLTATAPSVDRSTSSAYSTP